MSTNKIQTSFAGGELSPSLYARVDLNKYQSGAARMLNFFVDYRGGASNRPGTTMIARCLDSNNPVRLIPFQFSVIQNYILEFGNFYMRVIKDGGLVLEAALTLTGATNANPGVFTAVAHGFAINDQVYFDVLGMSQIDGKEYFVDTVPTANTFTVKDWNGLPLNTAGFGVFTSGTVARIYKLVTPYAAADLALLKFTQSADVMTLCHPDYVPRDLSRTSDTSWTLTPINIGAGISPPAGTPTVTPTGGAGTVNYAYVVTAVSANGEESVASTRGDALLAIDISAVAGSVEITWTPVADAVSYNVYKALPANGSPIPTGALFGYMATIEGQANTTAVDTNIVPDFTTAPPTNQNPFAASNNPGTVTYDQQRKVYAGSDAQPETFWMSKPGQFDNFDVSSPVQPSDAITGTLVSRQVNQIKHMVSMPGGLVLLTSGGAWQVSGAGGVLTPNTIQATPQAYNGAGDVAPLTINYEIIYVQQKGTIVRDLSYSFYNNIYTGADLSVLSNHLFTGYTLTEWAYAEEPFKIIWAVRSDGAALALTYLKDQEIFGWSKHETQGRFKSVATIPEGSEDGVYFVVQRLFGASAPQFIERMHTRQMPYGPEDAFFVDCGLSSELIYPDLYLFIYGIEGDIIIEQLDGYLSASNIGDVIRAAGGIATITSVISATRVNARVTRPFTEVVTFDQNDPPRVWGQLPGTWSIATPQTTFSGLDYLEGQTVAILGDGNVFTPQVVLNGSITLPNACTKVHIGLAYTAQLQTLYLDIGSEATVQGKRKNIAAMTARVTQTRGLEMGQTFDDLTEFKDRDLDTIGLPIDLYTGDQRMILGGGWNVEGQMCLQQSNPLPATVLGVIPEITLGDTGR